MKMRSQILLAQLPTAIIIFLITFFFILFLNSIKEKSEDILVGNFKSILTMQNMSKSLEELNELYIHSQSNLSQTLQKRKLLEDMIEQQLLIQDKNIKDSQEKELTRDLHKKWEIYKQKISRLGGSLFKGEASYKEIKNLTEEIVSLNHDGLIRTKEDLSQFISSILIFITFGSIISLIFGFYMSWFFTGLFLSPLNQMTEMMRQMGKEDKTTFLHIKGSDEIEELCEEFNLMTGRLEEYHQGSLGKAMKDYQILKESLDAFPNPIFLLDNVANFIYINRKARHLFGFSKDLKKMPSLFHIEEKWREAFIKLSNEVLMTKMPYVPKKAEDAISIDKEKKTRVFLPTVYPIKKDTSDEYQVVEGVVIILQNLVHPHLSEVRKTEAYEALVHEFQSPLTEIHMAIHLCVQEAAGPLTKKQQEILFAAREKCEYLEKLCQDLFEISRVNQQKNTLEQEDIDVEGVVLKLITSFKLEAGQKGIFIHFEAPPYLSKVKANLSQIKTLLGNLLRNALHYAEPGTTIKIKLGEKKNIIEFLINNKGSFIPLEYHKDIFKKHFKVPGQSEERSGLGLYIAKQITQSLGGKVGVKSTEKQGTTFWVHLPILMET